MHGIVYVVVNKKIREEVIKLFGLKGRFGKVSSVSVPSITKGKCSIIVFSVAGIFYR